MYIKRAAVLLSACLLASNATAKLLYQNDFENGWGPVDFHGGCYDYSFSLKKDSGNTVATVTNKGFEDNMVCPKGWMKKGKHRAEIVVDSKIVKLEPGVEYWIGYRVFVPADFPVDHGEVITAQTIGGGPGPEFLLLLNKNWRVERYWAKPNGRNTDYRAPAKFGDWTNWVIRLKRSHRDNAITQVWRDGKKVVDTHLKNSYRNTSPYFKVGIYWSYDSRPAVYKLWFDDIKVYRGSNGYDAVAPGSNKKSGEAPSRPTDLRISISP